jgi:hypothetical protein
MNQEDKNCRVSRHAQFLFLFAPRCRQAVCLVTTAILSHLVLGCTSISTLGLARPLDQGYFQVALMPAAKSVLNDKSFSSVDEISPDLECAVRYGMTSSVEIGVKLWQTGGYLETKIGLFKHRGEDGVLDVSIGSGIGSIGLVGYLWPYPSLAYLSLLLGANFGRVQIVLSPKIIAQGFFGGSRLSLGIFSGASLAVGVRVWKVYVLPELSLVSGFSLDAPLAGRVQFGLGFLFGGYDMAGVD